MNSSGSIFRAAPFIDCSFVASPTQRPQPKTPAPLKPAGRGFIALAIVIVGRRSPTGILLASLLFGLATALQFHFRALGLDVPFQFFLMLPYVLTLLVLAATAGRAAAPAALGRPYERP